MKNIVMICLFLVAGFTANAQKPESKGTPKTPEQRATNVANRLEKKLALSKEQKTKVHDLALARATKMDVLRAKYKDQDKKVWQAERKVVRDEFHSGMKATLSPEQFAKWEAQRKKAMAKGKGKPAGKTKPAPKGGNTPSSPDMKPDDSDAGDADDAEMDGGSK